MYLAKLCSIFFLFALSGVLQASPLPNDVTHGEDVGSPQSSNPAHFPALLARGKRRKGSTTSDSSLGSHGGSTSESASGSQSGGSQTSVSAHGSQPKHKGDHRPKNTKTKPSHKKTKPTTEERVKPKKPKILPLAPPSVPYDSRTFDTCVYVDCYKDDKNVVSYDDDDDDDDELVARSATMQVGVALSKRGARKYQIKPDNKKFEMEITSLDYPYSSILYTTKRGMSLPKHIIDFKYNTPMTRTQVKDVAIVPDDTANYPTEHIIELQTVKMFIEHVLNTHPSLEPFFEKQWNTKLDKKKVAARTKPQNIVMDPKRITLNDLVFQALGSNFNRKHFVLCEKQINSYKEALWSNENPMKAGKEDYPFEVLLKRVLSGKVPSNRYLSVIRTTIAVYEYMNMPVVKKNLIAAVEDVKTELSNVEKLTGEKTDLATMWETYVKKVFKNMDAYGKKWVKARIDDSLKKTRAKITEMRHLQNDLKRKEQNKDLDEAALHNERQNKKRKPLQDKLDRAKAALRAAELKEAADEKKKDEEIEKYQKAKGKALKKSLLPQKEKAQEDHKKARGATEEAKMVVGALEREILELTLSGTKTIVHHLRRDVIALQALEKRMAALHMPTI